MLLVHLSGVKNYIVIKDVSSNKVLLILGLSVENKRLLDCPAIGLV